MEAGESVPVPASVARSDLPVRAASALVMLAIAAFVLWAGGMTLVTFIILVTIACFVEFVSLVVRATTSSPERALGIGFGAIYIGLAALGLMNFAPLEICAILGIVVFTDTCAYFSGRTIGGPKIAPSISPSKTWAGLVGGMIGAAGWAALVGYGLPKIAFEPRIHGHVAIWAIIGSGLAVLAQMGDFFESWLKRKAGVKDSSRLIPGHGGVFDRVDGLLPVAIAVALIAQAA
ncbi:phosphatidate cytidylyltransferase [Porphyrobacter algicida]|uniref:Phosphatidate cytidylyltransferase n=1 Tax=Qipengyuania algicida TaxID=1836209 RepID=A0A845ADL5_9SPHN|nr:phosphatidate cytidylyltransferase [Qipengyuania algicida]MXP27323.1 phosphatidate cytidylyltransferase [Qipengyuania algicida]